MTEPRDRELSSIYRETESAEPPRRIDDAILAASRRAAGSRPRPVRAGLARRLSAPMALAATVLLTFTVTLMVFQDLPEPDSAQVLMQSGRADAGPEKPAQAEPGPPKPIPPPESRRDAKAQAPAESAFSSEQARARPPAFVLDARDALREKRESEPMRASRPTQPAPTAPASSASPRSETTSTPQGVGRVAATASRLAADEAKERSPEKWLEDIRNLKAQGKSPEAERELAEFRKRYPDYRLPEDLR
jgi:hypothetical protein